MGNDCHRQENLLSEQHLQISIRFGNNLYFRQKIAFKLLAQLSQDILVYLVQMHPCTNVHYITFGNTGQAFIISIITNFVCKCYRMLDNRLALLLMVLAIRKY